MQNQEKGGQLFEIDIFSLLRALLKRAWIILIAMVVCGAIGFGYVYFKVEPTYQTSVLFYVNSSIPTGSVKLSVSGSDISTARSLVSTYLAILKTRTTLDAVAQEAGLSYGYNTLSRMVSASAISGTEIFSVNVTSTSPSEAQLIANTIASVLPQKIANIVDGSSVRVVDYAVMPTAKVGPDLRRSLIIGMVIGFALSAGIFIIIELMDDQIHDEDFLNQHYPDIPVIGIIPDIGGDSKKHYGYYKGKYQRYGYQYRKNYENANNSVGKEANQ